MKKIIFNLLMSVVSLMAVSMYAMELVKVDDQSMRQAYFKDVPEEYTDIVEANFERYKKSSNGDRARYRIADHFDSIGSQEKYKINDNLLPFKAQTGSGYWLFNRDDCQDFCTGSSHPNLSRGVTCLSLKKDYKDDPDKADLLKKLVQDYKIHLMPKGPMYKDFDELLQFIKEDEELSRSIYTFKIKYNFDDKQLKIDSDTQKEVSPKIVIYCSPGKHNAQLVLNKMCERFKDKDGLNITPRYNQQVTSYIYYAQGNGDDKNIADFEGFFAKDKIHYELDWITWFKYLIWGKEYGYYLQISGEKNYNKLILYGVPAALVMTHIFKK